MNIDFEFSLKEMEEWLRSELLWTQISELTPFQKALVPMLGLVLEEGDPEHSFVTTKETQEMIKEKKIIKERGRQSVIEKANERARERIRRNG